MWNLLVFCVTFALAQTYVNNTFFQGENVVLTPENSPYITLENIDAPNKIEFLAGTRIEICDGCDITFRGDVFIDGTEKEKVVFDSKGRFGKIDFFSSNGKLEVVDCIFQNGDSINIGIGNKNVGPLDPKFIRTNFNQMSSGISAIRGEMFFENCQFSYINDFICGNNNYNLSPKLHFNNSMFSNNNQALLINNLCSVNINDTIFNENKKALFFMYFRNPNNELENNVFGCTFRGNKESIKLQKVFKTFILDNVFYNNTNYAIYVGGEPVIARNIFSNNGFHLYLGSVGADFGQIVNNVFEDGRIQCKSELTGYGCLVLEGVVSLEGNYWIINGLPGTNESITSSISCPSTCPFSPFSTKSFRDQTCNYGGIPSYKNEYDYGITCQCEEGRLGRFCEDWKCFDVLKNDSSVCGGQGQCVEKDSCRCKKSFKGDNCEELKEVNVKVKWDQVLEILLPVLGVIVCCFVVYCFPPLFLIICCVVKLYRGSKRTEREMHDIKPILKAKKDLELQAKERKQELKEPIIPMLPKKEEIKEYLERHELENTENHSRHFSTKYFVSENQSIDGTIFHDVGLSNAYAEISEIKRNEKNSFEVTVCDVDNDDCLYEFLKLMERKYVEERKDVHKKSKERSELNTNLRNLAKELIREVSDFFGQQGDMYYANMLRGKCKERVRFIHEKFSNKRGRNIVYLGELKDCGLCRHRSILFKLLCDRIRVIKCRILRGKIRKAPEEEEEDHMWNEIVIPSSRGGMESLTVDCMNSLEFITSEGEINESMYKHLGHPASERYDIKDLSNYYQKKRNGQFKLEILGRGGNSVVYQYPPSSEYKIMDIEKNEECDDHGLVAIKEVILSNDKVKKYVAKEVEMLNLLCHNNIVKYYGFFGMMLENSEVERACIVMKKYVYDASGIFRKLHQEKMKGQDQEDRETKHLVSAFVFFIFLEVARGLKYIHSSGYIHYDLKPSNILVNLGNDLEKREVVIADFGSHKRERMNASQTSHPHGTENYFAPEIKKDMKDENFTIKSDYYSFGKTLMGFKMFFEDYDEIIGLGNECSSIDPEDRPEIDEIITVLENDGLKVALERLKEKEEEIEMEDQYQY